MPKFREKIYLDTSIFNFYYAPETPEYEKATRQLFKEIKVKRYEAFISEVVAKEINAAPEDIKIRLHNLLKKYKLSSFELTKEVQGLAQKYIDRKIIPEKYRDDALHIALATINNVDALVSWNFTHIVKLKTKRLTKSVNIAEGYKEIEIVTPQELI